MEKQYGKVEKGNDGYKVVFTRTLLHSIEKVWQAITDPAKLRIWFTDIDMDFIEGGKMTIYFRDANNEPSAAKVVKIVPYKNFSFTWEDELAEFELTKLTDRSCTLKFTYSRFTDDFAVKIPAGWHILLDQLETVLDGRTTPYPFGGGPTEEGKNLQQEYNSLINK